jgi:hypothetical protein
MGGQSMQRSHHLQGSGSFPFRYSTRFPRSICAKGDYLPTCSRRLHHLSRAPTCLTKSSYSYRSLQLHKHGVFRRASIIPFRPSSRLNRILLTACRCNGKVVRAGTAQSRCMLASVQPHCCDRPCARVARSRQKGPKGCLVGSRHLSICSPACGLSRWSVLVFVESDHVSWCLNGEGFSLTEPLTSAAFSLV